MPRRGEVPQRHPRRDAGWPLDHTEIELTALAEELGNVSEACCAMGVARSTYYAWKPKLERYGRDGLRVSERRKPRMPN